jgi:stage II sporulation protein D (peptidoglycan lytic transglycosylase)
VRAARLLTVLVLTLGLGSTGAGARAVPAKRLGAAVAPITLVPRSGSTISVNGVHRYFGSIRIGSASDGLVLVDSLPLEKYLLGLNEVPATWPEEALKAQAVAARTFALYTLADTPRPDASAYGFDICATDQCQVFSGADVVSLPDGDRWRAAVDATAGQAVLYEGRPIFARYHSTSGGVTLSNSQGFEGEIDYPYLQPASSTTEQGSPLYRWRVSFSRPDLQALLERAGWWGDAGKLLSAASRPSSSGHVYPDVIFEGTRGRFTRTAEELRDIVRTLAPAMFPGKYPSVAPTTTGRLPETFPSNRVTISTRGRTVKVVGRGWGHGVGMSQWGAHGLAQQGASYVDILTHYYSGTTVGTSPEPDRVRVGLDWALSGATASGDFKIVDGLGHTLVPRALGTWGFRWTGSGAVSIDPPRGYGLPLRVGIVDAPVKVEVGDSAFLTVALSRPAKVQPVTSAPAPRESYPATIKEAGRRRIPWLAPLEPGHYRVVVRASTGETIKRSRPVEIVVHEPKVSAPVGKAVSPQPDEPDDSLKWIAALLLGAVTLAALTVAGKLSG